MSRHAYAFCVLEQFWRGLKRRDIYAEASTWWRNPQARLLEGTAWAAYPDVLFADLTEITGLGSGRARPCRPHSRIAANLTVPQSSAWRWADRASRSSVGRR